VGGTLSIVLYRLQKLYKHLQAKIHFTPFLNTTLTELL